MVDYSNACIYKLVCKDVSITDIYIGSTRNLMDRIRTHKNACINKNIKGYNYKVYKYIRENGGWENWKMVKICDVKPCMDRYDLHKAEGSYQRKLKSTLNEKISGRSKKEWKEDNKDKMKLWNKQYGEKNRDKANLYNKAYREKNKDKMKAYNKAYRAKKKLISSVHLQSSTGSG